MSLALLQSQTHDFNSSTEKINFRYHRFHELLVFGEKVIINRRKLRLMATEANRRKKEWASVSAVASCHQFVNLLVEASLEETRRKLRPFTIDVILGKESYSEESFRRRILNSDEIHKLHSLISLQLSTTLSLPVEHCSAVLKDSLQDPASFICYSAGLIAQYNNTIAITQAITKVTEAVYDKSLDHINPHWIVKKTAKKLSLSTALFKITDCHPVDQEKRCMIEIEKCLNGIIESFYQQLRHHYLRNIAQLIYSLHDSCGQARPRYLYLVKKARQS